jgi:hypothetical protein
MVSEDVFKNTRIYAVKKGMDISSFTEEALREKIENIQKEEQEQQKQQELATTVSVAKRLYQQIKQKPDFNSTMSADFIRSITAGIEPRHHELVIKAITQEDTQKQPNNNLEVGRQEYRVDQNGMDISSLRASRPTNLQSPQAQQQTRSQESQEQGSKVNIFEKDVHIPPKDEIFRENYPLIIPRFQFPTDKNKLIQLAKELEQEFYMKYKKVPLFIKQASFVLEKLPDKTYRKGEDLLDDLTIIVNDKEVSKQMIGKSDRARSVTLMDIGLQGENQKNIAMDNIMKADDDDRYQQLKRKKEEMSKIT